jgi:NAD(P)H-dependent flavin oxidoreductase YrpB (nitropropane dioxygenase family)
MPLIPAVVDAISPTPVVAAGGIADGRGLAAALALGAAGAWIGTRFLASEEAPINERYRKRLLQANENDTVFLENLFDVGWPDAPHRTLRNKTVEAWEAAGRPPTGQRPGEGEAIGSSPVSGQVVRYQSHTPGASTEGDIEAMSLWAGQSVGLVSTVRPAGEIVREICSQAHSILRRLGQ